MTTTKGTDPSLATALDVAGGATPPGIATGYEGGIGDQVKAYVSRVRSGEMGMLPAIAGLIVLTILFSALSPFFLTRLNIANLFTQSASLAVLAIALVFVILLGEIDLSAGVTAGVGMAAFVLLNSLADWNWAAALLVGLLVGLAIGTFIGYFVAKVGIPSFVVTLGLFLGLPGLLLVMLGDGNTYRIQSPEVLAIMNNNLPQWAGWVMWAVIVLVSIGSAYYDRGRRLKAGVPVRPLGLLWIRVAVVAVASLIFVLLLNQNRSVSVVPVEGVPIVVPITLAIIWIGTQVLDRTRFGLHLYAVGGNPEAARRAGINVAAIRISAFMICSTLAIVSGLFTASRVGTVGSSFGSTIVLNGVAAAVVGGVSLFGGRGRLVQAAVGAILISMITNGLGLLALPGGINLLITGGVLVLAATVDALSRKRSGASLART
ncbi:sugar ABC transporter permease [Amnibacterium setariae]|uniref:Xylose transport system permease protein XylH n=1 Tax=Amnibacterium setariae TaxID=2306585 RepID=A0A3A1U5Q2_9MICO|nr:ABC transporter permease [Amnibacterium setariae]RIX30777.1 ABC transporter permease [Amnibacterium setariae]